jgi:cytochrome c
MKTTLILFAATACFGSSALAADGAKLYAEKTCSACHGPAGNKPLMPDYPKIAGQNVKYIERQILDIKSGARANGNSAAMKGVMHLVDEAEIKAIAEYVSKLKP